jgi:hypothetical protein
MKKYLLIIALWLVSFDVAAVMVPLNDPRWSPDLIKDAEILGITSFEKSKLESAIKLAQKAKDEDLSSLVLPLLRARLKLV